MFANAAQVDWSPKYFFNLKFLNNTDGNYTIDLSLKYVESKVLCILTSFTMGLWVMNQTFPLQAQVLKKKSLLTYTTLIWWLEWTLPAAYKVITRVWWMRTGNNMKGNTWNTKDTEHYTEQDDDDNFEIQINSWTAQGQNLVYDWTMYGQCARLRP